MSKTAKGGVMKRTIATSALLCMLFATPGRADYTLSCKTDMVGGPEREDVVVKSTPNHAIDTLRDACAELSNNPLYSNYQRGTCVDPKGRDGTCNDPR